MYVWIRYQILINIFFVCIRFRRKCIHEFSISSMDFIFCKFNIYLYIFSSFYLCVRACVYVLLKKCHQRHDIRNRVRHTQQTEATQLIIDGYRHCVVAIQSYNQLYHQSITIIAITRPTDRFH